MRLFDPDRGALERALRDLADRLAAADGAPSVVVYYSGHSDAQGLLLGGERYPFEQLRRDLDALPAKVQVVVVDGCSSGALARAKGGVAAPAFLASPSRAVEGRAYLLSSSADEVSQEADHIGAGYFTHALLSGLRGGADFDGDGRVTLREAHQFATDETLARTVRTRLGAQHPTYDIQLSGVGDFVLTDLADATTQLRLANDLRGRVFLRDEDGHLVAELFKRRGDTLALGLPRGRYTAIVDDDGVLSEGTVRVADGETTEIRPGDLQPVRGNVTLARGRIYVKVPVAAQIAPMPTSHGIDTRDQLHNVSLGLAAVHAARLSGFQLGSVTTTTRDGVDGAQIAGAAAHTGGDARGVQIAGAVTNAGGAMGGVQMAGGLTRVGRTFAGWQTAGAVAWSGPLSGLQIAGGLTAADGPARGAQIAGGAAWASGDATALQMAGGLSLVRGDLVGVQLAGGAAWTGGAARGLQIAGGLAWAGSADGLQLAPVNAAKVVRGAQLGVVNQADDHRGFSLGVVHLSRSSRGVPFALVPIVGDGIHHLEVWAGTDGRLTLGGKLGSRHVYTQYAAGIGWNGPAFGLGFGVRARPGVWHVDVDAFAQTLASRRRTPCGRPSGPPSRAPSPTSTWLPSSRRRPVSTFPSSATPACASCPARRWASAFDVQPRVSARTVGR